MPQCNVTENQGNMAKECTQSFCREVIKLSHISIIIVHVSMQLLAIYTVHLHHEINPAYARLHCDGFRDAMGPN